MTAGGRVVATGRPRPDPPVDWLAATGVAWTTDPAVLAGRRLDRSGWEPDGGPAAVVVPRTAGNIATIAGGLRCAKYGVTRGILNPGKKLGITSRVEPSSLVRRRETAAVTEPGSSDPSPS